MSLVSLNALIGEASASLERGYAQHALELARHVLTRYPRAVAAYRVMGRACVELGQWAEAADLFKRVLGVDPEDWEAYAGLGIIYRGQGAVEEAFWHLERAFELAPWEPELAAALLALRGEREGREVRRLPLTRSWLARTYLRGQLLRYAIRELEGLLREDPERMDLQAALAEALWRSGDRPEAARVSLSLRERLPNCLKANLILAQTWQEAALEVEAGELLERAQAVEPTNRGALDLLGPDSPLPLQEALLAPPAWRMSDRLPAEASLASSAGTPGAKRVAAAEPARWPDLEAGEDSSTAGQGSQAAAAAERAAAEPSSEGAAEADGGGWPDLDGPEGPVSERTASGWAEGSLAAHPPAASAGEEPGEPPPWEEAGEPGEGSLTGGLEGARTQEDGPQDASEGMEELQARLAQEPSDGQARLALARLLLAAGRPEEGREHYQAALHLEGAALEELVAELESWVAGGQEPLRALLGDAYMLQGRMEEALEQYRAAGGAPEGRGT